MAESSRAAIAALFSPTGLFRHAEEQSPMRTVSFSPGNRSGSFSPLNTDRESQNRRAQTRLRVRNEKPVNTQVGEALYQRGQDLIQKRLAKAEELFRTTHTFQPQIDPNSKKMTQCAPRKPLYSAAKQPQNEVPHPSPRPSGKTVDLSAFLARNYETPRKKTAREPRPRKEEDESELKECTFQPKLDVKSVKMVVGARQKSKEGLYERGLKLREKQNKIAKEVIEARLSKELKECTFAPKVNQTPRSAVKKQLIIEPLPRLSETPSEPTD